MPLCLAACGQRGDEGTRELYELERLAFVPKQRYLIEYYRERHADCSIDEPLLVDLFELTRRDLSYYDGDGSLTPAVAFQEREPPGGEEERLDWPAYLSWASAREVARRRGMRLLTAKEWMHVATGKRSLSFPWGARGHQQASYANTVELGLGAPVRVGTFESGKSRRFGCYDLLGNVWEWVADVAPGYDDDRVYLERFLRPVDDGVDDGTASVFGGSYASELRESFGPPYVFEAPLLRFHARRLDRRTISPEIGVRMGADARAYLRAKAPSWGTGEDARRRVERVGALWAESSGASIVEPLLAELAGEPDAPQGLAWLLAGARGGP